MKLRIFKLLTLLTTACLLLMSVARADAATSGAEIKAAPGHVAASTKSQGRPQVLDRIVAVVNNGVILQSDLIRGIRIARIEMRNHGITPPPLKTLLKPVLNQLIMRKIQIEEAKSAGIHVTDEDLSKAIREVARRNGMTTAQFRSSLSQSGISISNVRRQLRGELMIARLRDKVVSQSVNITRRDVDLFLANQANGKNDLEYHLSYILVAVPENATKGRREAAKKKAQRVLKLLHGGANFAQMAIRYSDGAQALNGGNIGWRKTDNLPTMFASVVPHMKPGQISSVIGTANGYYIVKVTGRRSTQPRKTATEIHARQILLKPNALRNPSATKALINKLYHELQKGASFAKLASQYSDDLSSKDNGGDMGWEPRQSFDPEFRHQLKQLDPGQLSPPFHTDSGWHIVKLIGRRKHDFTKNILRAKAREAILRQREQSAYETWLRQQRAASYVDVRLKPGMITNADLNNSGPPPTGS